MPSLADLLENRLKREIAFSGAAGIEDVPLLQAIRDAQQQEALPAQQDAVPLAEEQDPLQELLLSYGSPNLEAERSPLISSPAPSGVTSLDRLRDDRGGRGAEDLQNLSAASISSGIAPSFSPEFEGLLEQGFGFLQDPTSIGRLAPVIGPAMGIAESIQDEDYLGALMSALGLAAPAGLAAGQALAAGYPGLAPSAAGQAIVTPDPLSSLEGLFDPGGRDQAGRSAIGLTEGQAGLSVGPEGYLSQTQADPFAFLEQGPAPGPAPVDFGGAVAGRSPAEIAAVQGLSGPAAEALGAGLQAQDVSHTVGAELAGFGFESGPSGYQFRSDEEEDDLQNLADALGVSMEAAQSIQAALGPSVSAALSGSAALGPNLAAAAAARARRGGGNEGGYSIGDFSRGTRSRGISQRQVRGGVGGGSGRGGGRGGGSAPSGPGPGAGPPMRG